MLDPLELQLPLDQLSVKYQSICTSDEKDGGGGVLLKDLAQQEQEKWFLTWVEDMVRVVRPGGLLVIENLSSPQCDEGSNSQGGVAREWWTDVLLKDHGNPWGIDSTSLNVMGNALREGRYHVVMRKKTTFHRR